MILFSISDTFLCDKEPGLLKALFPNNSVSPWTCPAKPRSNRHFAALNFSEKDAFLCKSLRRPPALFKSSNLLVRSSASDEGPTRQRRPFGSCNQARNLSRIMSVFFADKPVSQASETMPTEANAGIVPFFFLGIGNNSSSSMEGGPLLP